MIRNLTLALLLLPSIAFGQSRDPVPNLPIESYTLPNGLKVVLHRDPSVPRVTVCVAYHVGSKNERAGRTGFAHFFEHMMFRGTKNVPNYDIPLQETGAQSNAFTTEDMTVYFETVPSVFLDRAIYLEAERLAFLSTALEQDKFNTEREVVKNERLQSIDNVPYGLSEEFLLSKVFPKGHPYSWSVIGSMKDLNAATLTDLRQFFQEFYHPGNAALCLAGDFDPKLAKASIARYFEPIAGGSPYKPVLAPPLKLAETVAITEVDKVSQPRLYWSWPTVDDAHPDTPALDMLGFVMTNGEAARFHKAMVRDAKVATDVNASSDTKEVAGLFTLEATAAEGKTADDLSKAFAASMADLAANPPTDAELARALAKFEQATYRGLAGPLRRATVLAIDFVQKGDPAYYRSDYGRYYKVTTADLARVAKTYLTPAHVALTIVPMKPGDVKPTAPPAGPLAGSAPTQQPTRTPKPGTDWATLPGPSPAPDWQPPKYVKKTLSNGVEAWIVPWKTLPLVQASLIIPVGTADDPEGKSGLASLTATLLDKGTKTKTDTEFAEELENLGVQLAAGASGDSTSLGFSVLARNLTPTLSLVGQVLSSPRFEPKDFDRERKLQVEDLIQSADNPGWIAQRAFRALLFGPKHPYGHPADGYASTVKGLTIDDVKGFHARFAANRAKLIVVGDVDPEALVSTLESTLGAWKTTGPEPAARPPVEARPLATIYLVDKPGAGQTFLRVGRTWAGRKDPRYFAGLIGNRITGADFLSRLNANLREKNGYTYGIGSTFDYRRTGGVWLVSSSVRADVTAEALVEVMKELKGVGGPMPFTREEIAIARDAEARGFPEDFEDPRSIAGVFSGIAQFGLPDDYLSTYLAKLEATSDDQVRKVMAEAAKVEGLTILVVGDRASILPRLKALGFADVTTVDLDGKPIP